MKIKQPTCDFCDNPAMRWVGDKSLIRTCLETECISLGDYESFLSKDLDHDEEPDMIQALTNKE